MSLITGISNTAINSLISAISVYPIAPKVEIAILLNKYTAELKKAESSVNHYLLYNFKNKTFENVLTYGDTEVQATSFFRITTHPIIHYIYNGDMIYNPEFQRIISAAVNKYTQMFPKWLHVYKFIFTTNQLGCRDVFHTLFKYYPLSLL